jgi:DMSO reductase family type II enzyme heme b subunit
LEDLGLTPHSTQPNREPTPNPAAAAGIRFGAVAGVVALNLVILGYAIHRASPSHGEPTSAIAAVSGTRTPSTTPATLPTNVTSTVAIPAAAPAVVNPVFLPDAASVKGAYVQHCAACHGLDGRGEGPAAAQLSPRPRDFVSSPFRFASSGGDQDALIAGLQRIIATGVPRSPMPGFGGVLDESTIAGLARYVIALRSSTPSSLPAIAIGARPPTTPGLIARGAELYVANGCVTCHGESGHGDGAQARTLVDSIGRPVRPADLASGIFKSGQGPEDLCRVILAGVPGTPMIAYEAALTRTNPDGTRDLTDAWALVAYIQSLSSRELSVGHTSGASLVAVEAPDDAMLDDPAHVAWLGVSPISIELRPLWQRVETITHVDVRAVSTGARLAICAEWRDGTMDVEVSHAVFPDAVAVMFAMGADVPALPMGVHVEGFEARAPVNLWYWRASRQYRALHAESSFEPGTAPRVTWRVFGLPRSEAPTQETRAESGFPTFRTARDAGNVHESDALTRRSTLEANAEGFGTLAWQPSDEQHVTGTALWSNGVWRVVMARSLETNDPSDIELTPPQRAGARIPITFAVWDGSKGDRDGLKLISGWHWLSIAASGADALGVHAQLTSVPAPKETP